MNSKIVIIGVTLLFFSIAIFFMGVNEWFTASHEFDQPSMNFFNGLAKLFLMIGVVISPIIIMVGISSKHKTEPLIINSKRVCPTCYRDIPMGAVTCPCCGKDFFMEKW